MPKYLIEASYTHEGVKGLQKAGGSSRRDAVAKMVEGEGGRLESLHFAFGDADVYVIAHVPDHASAAAISLAANTSDGLTAQTIVLMTPEEFDAATEKQVTFRPPGA